MSALKMLPLDNVDIHPSTAKRNEQKAMSKKEDGFTPLPNFICDEGYLAELSGEAIKCVVFLNRHINGFHIEQKSMSESLVTKITGIKDNRTIRKYMSELAKFKLIEIIKEKGKSNKYRVTFDDRLPVKPVPSHVPSSSNAGTSHVTAPVASHVPTTSDMGCHSVKEKKIKIKERGTQENPVEGVLSIWKPNLHDLNSWLQRSGLPKINQDQAEEILLEVNPCYEERIRDGLLSDNQMYSNFVKWIKRDTKLTEKLFEQAVKSQTSQTPQNFTEDKGDW